MNAKSWFSYWRDQFNHGAGRGDYEADCAFGCGRRLRDGTSANSSRERPRCPFALCRIVSIGLAYSFQKQRNQCEGCLPRSQSQCWSSRIRISSPFSRLKRSRRASAAACSPTRYGSSRGLGVREPASGAASNVGVEAEAVRVAVEDEAPAFSSEAQRL
jgi:hypothetical protein